MVIAGVMSGSSLDGLDVSIVRFNSSNEWQLLWRHDMAYTDKWVRKLKRYEELTATGYIELKSDFSRYIGKCLNQVFELYSGEIDYVSFHGHTLAHHPDRWITEQIGNGGTIAALVNIPTITDFRVQDVTKGGVGTPLAPLAELNLFQGHDYYLNLGGIANITKINDTDQVIAYDVCPCNQVLNYFSNQLGKEYDNEGHLARSGRWIPELEAYLNTIPYFKLKPPKSLDNNWIVNEVIPNIPDRKPEDILHTYTIWVAATIANEIDRAGSATSLMVSGGGAHNTYFMELLREKLSECNCSLLIPSKDIIDFKEAILMALMARKYILSEPNVLSAVTGASSDSIGGALYKV